MLAYPLAASLPDLLGELAQGHPVLVLQDLGLPGLARLHYAVVIGYDLARGELLLRSGTTRRLVTTLASFERSWARAGHRAWVILPAGQVPHSARAAGYLQAALELEQGGQAAAAGRAWLAATRRWPAHARAWLALGNSRFRAQDYTGALSAIRRATELEPREPAAWNNLAYTLLQTGCPRQALTAARCARQLAPSDARFDDTLRDIEQQAAGADAAHCRELACQGN